MPALVTPTLASLLMCTLAAPSPEQLALLKTFRQEFVEITPGAGKFPANFMQGSDRDPSERPVRRVTLDGTFFVAKYEVPQNLWEAVMGNNPSRWKGPRNSVEMVSFDDCQAFCKRATELMRAAKLIAPHQVIRLPSESEWEYVARAGTTTAYSFGDSAEELGDYGWFTGNAAGNDPPVGAKRANPWGLYDLHGYLWEWCLDHGQPNYEGAPTDGSAWLKGDGKLRVLRGGSWKDPAKSLTSSCRAGEFRTLDAQQKPTQLRFRGGVPASLRDDAVGLRCVLATLPENPPAK